MSGGKVIVFDFDGVIIPSEELKVEAYTRIFTDFGEEAPEEAIREARQEFADARGNRFDAVRGIFRRTGRAGDIEKAVQTYGGRYGDIVRKGITELRVDDATRKTLERLSKIYPLYINSNNPDEFLREMLRMLGIEPLFKGIYSSLHTKVENLRDIAKTEHLEPNAVVFIGDGEGDRKAADDFGCTFIGVATKLNGWQKGKESFHVVSSLGELDIT